MAHSVRDDLGPLRPLAGIEGLDALLDALNAGETIRGGSPHHQTMHAPARRRHGVKSLCVV